MSSVVEKHEPGRPDDDLEVLHRLEALARRLVADRQPLAHARRALEVGVLHPERLEDALAHHLRERAPAQVLDDQAQQREAVVGVGPLGPGRDRGSQRAGVVLAQRRRGSPGFAPSPITGRARSDGRRSSPSPLVWVSRWRTVTGAGASMRARVAEVVDRGVELERALLDQLHHRDGGHRLGDRADAEHRVALHRAPGVRVGHARGR